MATTDQRIRDLARVIHEKHGDEAVTVALERARNWREAEDPPMAAVWIQVAEECRKLRSHFAQTRLPERPVVNAVERDDDERHREVVAALTRAKRKIHD